MKPSNRWEAGNEWCITEDAELSLRLLRAGWVGRHVETSFGRGVMPLTFDALKRQRFRWCFGGIQILRMHWRSLLPWNRDPGNRMSTGQRLAYLSGGLQWYGDLLGLAFAAFLLATIADLALGTGVVFRRLTGFVLVAVPALAAINLGRAVALLRRVTAASWRDAPGAFGIWMALSWTVARASLRGAVSPTGVFLRTPKTRGEAVWSDAIRTNRAEIALAGAGLTGMAVAASALHGPTRWLLPILLVVPVMGQLSAPLNSAAAQCAELPDELRRRRRSERLRAWAGGPLRPTRILGGTVLAGLAVVALVMFSPGSRPGPTPSLLHEARGHGAVAAVPATAPRTSRPVPPEHGSGGTSGFTRTGPPSTTAANGGLTGSTTPARINKPRAIPTSIASPAATPTSTTPTVTTPTVTTPTPTTTAPTTTAPTTTLPGLSRGGPPTSTPGTTPGGPPTSRPGVSPTTRSRLSPTT